MRINEGIAELYGAMIGDGCLSRYFSNYKNKYEICFLITGHSHDEVYHREVLQPILFKNFGVNGYINLRKKYHATLFRTSNKIVFNFFKDLGFPIGIKNKLRIPRVIFKNNNLAMACLRGIFDTDGTIYLRYSKKYENHFRKYDYKNIQFHMKSKRIIYQIKRILDKNLIGSGKIFERGGYWGLRIYNQNSVKLFFKLIRPSNPYHKERFLSL